MHLRLCSWDLSLSCCCAKAQALLSLPAQLAPPSPPEQVPLLAVLVSVKRGAVMGTAGVRHHMCPPAPPLASDSHLRRVDGVG